MRDSRIKEPSGIYAITQTFYRCIIHRTLVSYVLLSSYRIHQTIKRNESLECM